MAPRQQVMKLDALHANLVTLATIRMRDAEKAAKEEFSAFVAPVIQALGHPGARFAFEADGVYLVWDEEVLDPVSQVEEPTS